MSRSTETVVDRFRRGCADGYCAVKGRAAGMHTNGGCRCVREFLSSDLLVSTKAREVDRLLRLVRDKGSS